MSARYQLIRSKHVIAIDEAMTGIAAPFAPTIRRFTVASRPSSVRKPHESQCFVRVRAWIAVQPRDTSTASIPRIDS